MFHSKQYQQIAEILSAYHKYLPNYLWDSLVGEFINVFNEDNPRFDKAKFIAACEKDYS